MGTQNYALTCVGIFSNFFGRLRCSVGPESVKKLTSDNGYNCFLFMYMHWEKNLTWMWYFRKFCEGSPAEVVYNYGFSVMHLEESPRKIDMIITKRITDIT